MSIEQYTGELELAALHTLNTDTSSLQIFSMSNFLTVYMLEDTNVSNDI
jgi:hypothetical protein